MFRLPLRRLGGNHDRLRRLLAGFLRDYAGASEQMRDYLERGDMAEVASLAHSVKGSASYFDAHELCGVAEQLEMTARRDDPEEAKYYGPLFQGFLEELLQYLEESIAGFEGQKTTLAQVDLDAILSLLERAAPLVAHGDYAAQALLEQICSGLVNRDDFVHAERARLHYEELELESSNLALQKLKTSLQSRK